MYRTNNYLLLAISYLDKTFYNWNAYHVVSSVKDVPQGFRSFFGSLSILLSNSSKAFYYQTLGLFLRYSYNLADFHPDILIEAILI